MFFEKKISRSDMLRCALCNDAPCSSVCKTVDPAAKLFNIWFDNEREAASKFPADNPCASCGGDCEKACVRPHEVPIRKLMMKLQDEVKPELEDDQIPGQDLLKTDFCGIPIENPFFLSSSVVASTYDMCARAFEAGWAGVSFKTVCSIPIHEVSPRFSAISGDNGEIIGFKNIEQLSDHSAAENMQIFRDLKKNYPSKFILASIMGTIFPENPYIFIANASMVLTGMTVLPIASARPLAVAHPMRSHVKDPGPQATAI